MSSGRSDSVTRLPIGRADGIGAITAGEVLVHGHRCPIVGRISLEHCRVDVTAVPGAQLGDEVVIIGRQGSANISMADVAAKNNTDEVGVLTAVGPRVARAYRDVRDSAASVA